MSHRSERQGDHNYVASPVSNSSSDYDSRHLGNTDHDYAVIATVNEAERGEQRNIVLSEEDSDDDVAFAVGLMSDSESSSEDESDIAGEMDNEIIVIDDDGNVNEQNSSGNTEGAVARSESQDDADDSSDSDMPAPSKKPKHSSTDTANSNEFSDNDVGLLCIICLEICGITGDHRLVSLRCGHLFGDVCIRRWFLESLLRSGVKTCPQCKARASNRDIRYVYNTCQRAIDRSEEQRLRQELEKERCHSQALQTELDAVKIVANQLQSVQAENDRMKQFLRSTSCCCYYANNCDPGQVLRPNTWRLRLEHTVGGSRLSGFGVLLHAVQRSAIIVSQRSEMFISYGLRFIDIPTFCPISYMHTSDEMVRDVCLNTEQNLLAVASMERQAKMFDLRSNEATVVFDSGEKPLWACAMDCKDRENSLYLGGSNGSTYLYDIRFPQSIVEEYKFEDEMSAVMNVAAVNAGGMFPFGGLLVCKLLSICFYEYTCRGTTATGTRLNIEGPFGAMNYDASRETMVISVGATVRNPQARYIFGRLEKVDGTPVFHVKATFNASRVSPLMTRCSQLPVEANILVAGYLPDVQQLGLFDVRREHRVQSLPMNETVYDICPVFLDSQITYLAALTENKLSLYKMISEW